MASLAAAGLAAREIAARLGLELRVVEAELAAVYRKRGVTGRSPGAQP